MSLQSIKKKSQDSNRNDLVTSMLIKLSKITTKTIKKTKIKIIKLKPNPKTI